MAYSFRRGVRAMTVTSATTAAAFYANLISPIMPIRAFGLFAGTLIPVNFLLIIIMMPAGVIWYENTIKYKACCCCVNKRLPNGELVTVENDPAILIKGMDVHSKVQKFFDTTWNTFVFKARYVIIVVTLIWFGLTCYFAPQMGPQTEQPKFISDDNPVWKPIAIFSNEFDAQADFFGYAYVFWGVGEIDREGEN
jgi:predicted RND superfamily exporter protein